MSDLISRQAALISLEKSMNLNQMRERLKRLPSVQSELAKYSPKLDNENEELISRQAAIDAIMGQPPEPYYPSWYAEQIKALSSVQPEIIRCKNCKWWDKSEDSPFGYCMAMKHGYMTANWEIGIYRRYKGDFYCADAERRTDK